MSMVKQNCKLLLIFFVLKFEFIENVKESHHSSAEHFLNANDSFLMDKDGGKKLKRTAKK